MDYAQPELTLLLVLLKESNNNISIRQNELSWGLPTAVDPQANQGRDTSIKATVINSDRYRGNSTFFYSRVPMRRLIAQCMTTPRITIGGGQMLSENLSFINQALSLGLEVGSITDIDLTQELVNYDTWTPIFITANQNSRVYSESVKLYLKRDSGAV